MRFRLSICLGVLVAALSVSGCQTKNAVPGGTYDREFALGNVNFGDKQKVWQYDKGAISGGSLFNARLLIKNVSHVIRSHHYKGDVEREQFKHATFITAWAYHNKVGFFQKEFVDYVSSRATFEKFLNHRSREELVEFVRPYGGDNGRGYIAQNNVCNAGLVVKRLKGQTNFSNDTGQPDTVIYTMNCNGLNVEPEEFFRRFNLK